MREWTTMRRQDFDADEPLSLFDPPAGQLPALDELLVLEEQD
jgi:hypothetical protein